MYCPNCKDEYREGFVSCARCDVALVAELPKEPPKEISEEITHANWQHLFTVSNDMEASFIESFLDGENIPVYKKPIGIGAYMQVVAGQTNFGIQILVPEDCLEKAIEVVKAYRETELPETDCDDDDCDDFEKKHEIKKGVMRFSILWIFVAPFLVGIGISLAWVLHCFN